MNSMTLRTSKSYVQSWDGNGQTVRMKLKSAQFFTGTFLYERKKWFLRVSQVENVGLEPFKH